MAHRTKEELFMLRLYEMANLSGDVTKLHDRYAIGAGIGLSYRVVNAICNTLLQANFIKKEGEAGIYLTPRGITLVQTLLSE